MKVLYIITFLEFFSLLGYAQNDVYKNDILEIQFEYSSNDGNSPYGYIFNESRTNDTEDWKSFVSKLFGISFKYPNSLVVKEEKSDNDGRSNFNYKLSICYRNLITKTKLYPVIEMYFSDKSFEEIANDNNFEKDTIYDKNSWVVLGQLTQDATYFEGKKCASLRGTTAMRMYHCGGGYIGQAECPRALLVFFRKEKPSLVLVYNGSWLGDCEEEEGVPDNDVWEDEFYIVASTIKEISNK